MKTAKGVLIERYEQYKTDLEQAKLDIEKQEKKLEESQESRIRVEKLIKEFKEALDGTQKEHRIIAADCWTILCNIYPFLETLEM